jgi:rubrerythrin
MDILEYALQMEKDGENFYRRIASQTNSTAIKAVMNLLADEEVKHYHVIEQIAKDRYEMAETDILNNAKNIFIQMKDKEEEFTSNQEQVELYRKAQEIEKQSQQFYTEKATQMDKEELKKLFEQLAKEEEKHYFLLENIIDFVLRPKHWLENAEWYHLNKY